MELQLDIAFMHNALELAKKAEENAEVPIGAIITKDKQIIAKAYNQPISLNDPCAHAEILALRRAATALGNYRLLDTTLYVTLEPCAMCAVALIHARVKRVVFGAYDPRQGAIASVFQLLDDKHFNHQLTYTGGILEEECGKILKDFFLAKRA